MESIYLKNYKKYSDLLSKISVESYEDLVKVIETTIVPKKEVGEDRKAMVLFGFSGNGKSTWIRNFQKENPDYIALSFDDVIKRARMAMRRELTESEKLAYIGKEIERVLNSGRNVLFDGNFLNLLTRMVLVDSLHERGYDVSLVDITPLLDVTLERRIMDEARRFSGGRITSDNVEQHKNNPFFLMAKQKVMNYHETERRNACYDEQMLLGLTSFGVERVITIDTPKQDGVGGKKK